MYSIRYLPPVVCHVLMVVGLTLPASHQATSPGSATGASAQRPISVPLDLAVPVPPTAFKAVGKMHLAYEMYVTNFARPDCTLTRIEVLSQGSKQIARFEGNELSAMVQRPGVAPETEKLKIGGGLRAVVHVWLTLESPSDIPVSLVHRLGVKVGDYPEEMTLEGSRIGVLQKPVVISPPLRGSEWLAANGPSNISGHRRALIPIDGHAYIAQRFAIDWLQLREDGRTFTGDSKDNKNYRCYGAEALAVADALVVGVKDGIPENIPGPTSRAVPITLETVGGNFVILDLGQGRYAFYAHLQPGSLRVKLNDKVRRGQVLGLVGNSGNSTEPHLHFHVSDGNSPLGSNGLPYVITEFEVQGKGFGWKPSTPPGAIETRRMELPSQNEVVRFKP